MEILVAVLVVAAIAVAALLVMQRRAGGAPGLRRPRTPAPAARTRSARRADPMTAAVVEHAQVTDPAQVPAAEARLRAQARRVAAPLQAEADRAEQRRAADPGAPPGAYAGERVNGYDDPSDAAHGDRYDPRYDGRA